MIGTGYVGLVTAACLASLGHRVYAMDIDRSRIDALRAGIVPISEPGLEPLVRQGLREGRLSFHTDLGAAAESAEIAIVAVGTLDAAGRWTGEFVHRVVTDLLELPAVPATIAVRSTLRPGRMQRLQQLVAAAGPGIHLVLNPEFTREGSAVADFLAPDRIVVGIAAGAPEEVAEPMRRLYAAIAAPLLVVDHASAELIKIGSNAFLAAKLTFANELARVCVAAGADMAKVREGMGLDRRIGPAFLATGPGFGGSCLPSQVELLSSMSDELDLDLQLIPAVHRFNRQLPRRLVRDLLADMPTPRKVAILGLAFKANTDDTRESPALRVIDALGAAGVTNIHAYDPVVRSLPAHPTVTLAADPYTAATGADLLVIATEWPEFRALDWLALASVMAGRRVFDARSVVAVDAAMVAGFNVASLERRAGPAHARRDESPTGEPDARADHGEPDDERTARHWARRAGDALRLEAVS